MNKAKIILLHLVLLILIVGGYLYGRSKKSNVPNLVVQANVQKEETKLYTVQAEYPLFENAPRQINQEIEAYVNNKITDFKKSVADNWQIRKNNPLPGEKIADFPESPWPFTLTWTFQRLTPEFISLALETSEFIGGANEVEEIFTYNYDLKSKKKIALEDLFPGNPDYLKKVSDFAKDDLISQFKGHCLGKANIPADMITSGTTPKLENFSHFTFDQNSITFYFPKYQVAPGVEGEQKVVMGRE
ncbi:MAG: DUF3298 and DUF4163 domain-containing protein [Patescibacteria group bacterium]|nr:DUF3298 and DUF4163 domain-containing protein [Patescibacteria group bacterium]